MSERRRRWPWAVAAAALAITIALSAEPAARWFITNTVQAQVRAGVGLDADHPVRVDFTGGAMAAMIRQELPGLAIEADDVPLGEIVGDVRVELSAVTFAGDVGAMYGTVRITPETLQALLLERLRPIVEDVDALGGFASLEVDEPYLVVGTAVTIFDVAFPLDIAMNVQPAAEMPGSLFVAPAELRLDGHTLTADEIRSTFGGGLAELFDGWTVCVADGIPRGLDINGISMIDGVISVDIVGDGDLLADEALRELGSC